MLLGLLFANFQHLKHLLFFHTKSVQPKFDFYLRESTWDLGYFEEKLLGERRLDLSIQMLQGVLYERNLLTLNLLQLHWRRFVKKKEMSDSHLYFSVILGSI
jgi:hypothetical protein